MTLQTVTRQRIIELIEELPAETLPEVAQFVEFLRFKSSQSAGPSDTSLPETALLEIIQRRLPPDEQNRLSYLRQRNEEGKLTKAEHAELSDYVDRVEQADAERAEALVKLARLREAPLTQLMDDLRLESTADVA